MLIATMMIQSPSDTTLLRWMQTNAPAAWITALVAIVTCGFLIRFRKKPKRLVFREIRNISVVTIWPSVRDKIKIAFADKPIQSLGQIEGEVFNSGSDAIQNPTFALQLPEESVVLDVSVRPQNLGVQCKIDRNTINIALPYLNPFRDHGQIVKLSLLTDGRTKIVEIGGGGEGWSVRYLPVPSARKMFYLQLGPLILAIAAEAVLPWYGRFIESRFGIPPAEVSWRAFVATSPLWLVLIVLLVSTFFSATYTFEFLRNRLRR